MDWTEIGKAVGPAAVGAGSAILSALLTNLYAERRHRRELASKERELNRRTLEVLTPHRLAAYQAVFVLLQKIKIDSKVTAAMLDELTPHLFWVDPDFAKEILGELHGLQPSSSGGKPLSTGRIAELQERIRELIGAPGLNQMFKNLQRL